MLVTFVYGENIVSLDFDGATSVQTIKSTIRSEVRTNGDLTLTHHNTQLSDDMTLRSANVQPNDVILVTLAPASEARPTTTGGGAQYNEDNSGGLSIPQALLNDPAALQQYFRANPALMRTLSAVNPQLARAINASDTTLLSQMLQGFARQNADRIAAEARNAELNARIAADPLSAEAQQLIAEEIRQANIQANMEAAVEHTPEVFARVVMLYVPLTVNGVTLNAFIDSGAQSTIMSAECAERCHISHLIDTRFAGVAKGVGTARILGRVHSANVRFGKIFFTSSFTILESNDMQLLFGLDQLRKHRAVIDLEHNQLVIGDERVDFLPEHKLEQAAEEDDERRMTDTQHRTAPNPRPIPSSSSSSLTQPTRSTTVNTPSPRPVPAPAVQTPSVRPATSTPASAPAPIRTAPAPVQQQQAVSEESLRVLTELGFDRAEATRALIAANGDENIAASILFSG